MTENGHLDFTREHWDEPVRIFDKSWVIATRHSPALNRAVELNNRVFVFQLRNKKGEDALLVHGCGNERSIDAVRRLEKETGVPVGWVLSNGGAHHLFLGLWYEAFPDARILVPAKRIPFTRNGLELAKKHADRWELMHGPRPEQVVNEFGDQIDVVIFDQLFQYADQNAADIMASPKDHTSALTSVGGFSLMFKMSKLMKDVSQPNDEVTLFHRPSGMVVGGHNYQFSYVPKGHKPPKEFALKNGGFPVGLMFKMLMPEGAFVSTFEGMPGPIADSKIHAEEWQMVLDWDIRAWTSSHNPPTVCGPDMSGAEIKTAIRASLARTGEDDPSGARLKWNEKHRR